MLKDHLKGRFEMAEPSRGEHDDHASLDAGDKGGGRLVDVEAGVDLTVALRRTDPGGQFGLSAVE
ncbi:MAG: hypothetical protein JWO62_125 [Acidimicrobiaceae bacterium]|nr:hypothetical protein [Acidimicrobiaceae bacterium]